MAFSEEYNSVPEELWAFLEMGRSNWKTEEVLDPKGTVFPVDVFAKMNPRVLDLIAYVCGKNQYEMSEFQCSWAVWAFCFWSFSEYRKEQRSNCMSWDIALLDPETGIVAVVERHQEGGTYALGGLPEASLNVTYNYGKHFDFKQLNGKSANETIPLLSDCVHRLGTKQSSDYWKPTRGNVGYACSILLKWARLYPSYTWEVV